MKRIGRKTTWLASTVFAIAAACLAVFLCVDPRVGQTFVKQGLPDWLGTMAGTMGFCAGLALLVPRIAWHGSVILGLICAEVIWLIVGEQGVPQNLIPAAVLAPLAILATVLLQRARLLARVRAAADMVAEREIALSQERRRLRKQKTVVLRPVHGNNSAHAGS